MRTLLTFFLAGLAVSGVADARSPCPADVKPGMSYHTARAMLIEAGYQPIHAPAGNENALNARFKPLGYLELFDTAMSMPETSPLFLWGSETGKFIVETRGDKTPVVVSCDPY